MDEQTDIVKTSIPPRLYRCVCVCVGGGCLQKARPVQIQSIVDDNLNVDRMMIFVSDRLENIVGKGENVGYLHLLLSQYFQEASFSRSLKVVTVW